METSNYRFSLPFRYQTTKNKTNILVFEACLKKYIYSFGNMIITYIPYYLLEFMAMILSDVYHLLIDKCKYLFLDIPSNVAIVLLQMFHLSYFRLTTYYGNVINRETL